jgi:hypothetical protein
MKTRTFLVAIVAVVLVAAMANVSWADGRGRGWPARGIAPSYHRWDGHGYPHHAWYEHSYRHPGYRYYYAPSAVYVPVPRAVYVPAPGVLYAPVPEPVYGGGYIGAAIAQPGWSISWSVNLP